MLHGTARKCLTAPELAGVFGIRGYEATLNGEAITAGPLGEYAIQSLVPNTNCLIRAGQVEGAIGACPAPWSAAEPGVKFDRFSRIPAKAASNAVTFKS